MVQTTFKFIKPFTFSLACAAFLLSCKAPMATKVEDTVKTEIPQNFNSQPKQPRLIPDLRHGSNSSPIQIWLN